MKRITSLFSWLSSGELGDAALKNLLISGGGVLLAFVLQPVLARSLGPYELGEYSFVLSVVTVLVLLAVSGVDSAIVRELPALRAKGDRDHTSPLVSWGAKRVLFLSVAIGAVLVGISCVEGRTALLAGALFLPVWGLLLVRQAVMRGEKKFLSARSPDVLGRPAVLVVLLLLLWWGGFSSATTAMGAQIVAGLLMLLLFGGRILKALSGSSKVDAEVKVRWRKGATALALFSVLTALLTEADKLALGFFSTKEELGIYSVASRLTSLVALPIDALLSGAVPLLSEALARGDKEKLSRLVKKISWSMRFAGAVPAVVLLLLAPFIGPLFGHEFAGAGGMMAVLIVGQVGNALLGPGGYLLVVASKDKELLTVVIVCTVIGLFLMPFLAYSFGGIGVAAGSGALLVARNGAFWFLAKRYRIAE